MKDILTILMASFIAMTSVVNAEYVRNDPVNNLDPDGRQGQVINIHPGQAAAQARVDGAIVGGVVDFLPVVGDAKGVGEAVANPTPVNIAAAAIGIVPAVGDVGKGALKQFTNITDHGDGLIEATFDVAEGSATVLGEVTMDGTKMLIDGAHIQGEATIKEALGAAKDFGKSQGATEVTIQGAARTTGANPGHTPKPITLQIDEPKK